MGKSLFNIEEEYLQLMQEIEELEGELTPELDEKLKINQEELESKIKAYHHIIENMKGDMQLIKDESERLANLKKSKESLIDKLKGKVLNATTIFGYDGKSGNKKLDFDTLKVYTVNKDKIEVDEVAFSEYSLNTLCKDITTGTEALEYILTLKVSHAKARGIINAAKGKITEDDFVVNMSKDKIKTVIESGIEVPHCSKINNPYVTFR